jgi:glucan biosynthesis protein C
MSRHYGMDWLRIGAFALLILYHIGMVFVPWGYHVKTAQPAAWVEIPLLLTNPWRLTLLFVVSGYASRALLRRSGGVGGFIANRSYRLLVPLAFGMAVIVPPQPWIELITKHHYTGSYPTFWFADYFRFAPLAGIPLPTWNHLWFVVYLWVYTAVLAIAMLVVRGAAIQRGFDRMFGGIGVVLLPLAWLVCVHSWWFPMAAIARWWRLGAAIALAGYAFIVAVELVWPGEAIAPRDIYPFYGAAHALQQWGAIVALIGIAELYWNRDRAIRPMLTEAVFPFYLIHQTIIVVVMWALLPAGLPGWAEFAILVASTIAGCWGFYLIGRAIPPLRPLIGLRGVARGSV